MMQEPTEKAVILSAVWSETSLYDITSHSAFPLLLVRDLGICSFLVSVALGIFSRFKLFPLRYFRGRLDFPDARTAGIFRYQLLSIGIMGIYLMNILNESKKCCIMSSVEKMFDRRIVGNRKLEDI